MGTWWPSQITLPSGWQKTSPVFTKQFAGSSHVTEGSSGAPRTDEAGPERPSSCLALRRRGLRRGGSSRLFSRLVSSSRRSPEAAAGRSRHTVLRHTAAATRQRWDPDLSWPDSRSPSLSSAPTLPAAAPRSVPPRWLSFGRGANPRLSLTWRREQAEGGE